MDPADLERKITRRTKLILPIHMAGSPCNMDAIMAVARKHKIPVLEDCAQCNGGTFQGRKVGTFGDMGIFSLQLNKNMTCGEGGLLITNDEKLYYRAFSAHDMGLVRKDGRLATPEPYAIAWGGGRRMTELCGAVASVQIKKLPQIVGHMRASNNRIKALLERHARPGIPPPQRCRRRYGHVPDPDGGRREQGPGRRGQDEGIRPAQRVPDRRLRAAHLLQHSLAGRQGAAVAGRQSLVARPRTPRASTATRRGPVPTSDALFARSILLPIPSRLTRGAGRGGGRGGQGGRAIRTGLIKHLSPMGEGQG